MRLWKENAASQEACEATYGAALDAMPASQLRQLKATIPVLGFLNPERHPNLIRLVLIAELAAADRARAPPA